MVGIYIHIPFCVRKCHYCDCNSVALGPLTSEAGTSQERLVGDYLAALEREITHWHGQVQGRTLYLGGGTPTFLSPDRLRAVLHCAREAFALPEGAEITVEANPGTLDEARLEALREGGVNRLSLGVQSFDDDLLAFLGRIHRAEEVRQSYRQARAAGFRNISLDLIFGLPRQSLQKWEDSLQQALNLSPEHVSLYGLVVEEGTPLAQWITAGYEMRPSQDVEAEMYSRALDLLPARGYEQYEISNFARPGYRCLHNDIYWGNEPYLGLGVGACSYLRGERFRNVDDISQYLTLLSQGERPVGERERLPRRGQMGETMMLGLRRTDGVAVARFQERFGCPPEAAFAPELEKLRREGLLTTDGTHWKLTRQGMFLANRVFLEFV